ncbi:polysaccharide biosynthesis C-terminal domain-containing protein [Thalassovita sp.]|uniref:oligosaccharide flippase family protein n=1 Tax=Thalassovita sp. TaxID=1979401 RepID=UPI003B5BA068
MKPADTRISGQGFGSVLRTRLVRAGLGTAALRVIGLALTLGTSVLLARVMGPEGLGTYTLAFAAISLLGIPVQMGIPALVLRETARAQAVADWPRLRGIWFWATRRILLVSALIALSVVVAVFTLPVLPDGARSVFLLGIPLIPVIALSQIRAAALRGLGRVIWGQLPEILIRPALLVLLVLACTAVVTLTPRLVMGLHLVAAAIAFTVGMALLMRARPAELLQGGERQIDPTWARAVLSLALIAGAQSITANADFLMLGWWQSEQQVGVYKVATSGASLTVAGLGVLAMITNPRFAALHQTGDSRQLARLAAYAAVLGFAAALPVLVIFAIWGAPILSAVFGPAFAGGAAAMLILTAGQTLSAFFGACIGLLNMTGHERQAMRGVLISALLNVALNVALIPPFGIEGAAVATLISTAVWNLLLWWSVRRHLGLDSSVLGLWSWRRA